MFCDSRHIRYGCTRAGLQPTHGGCGASFDTHHDFSCAKGGLIIIRRNELREELCDMVSRAFQPSTVRNEPKIHLWRAAQAEKTCCTHSREWRSWRHSHRTILREGGDCILGIHVTKTYTVLYKLKEPSKALEVAEHLKKKQYL
jgi:hypothetical protein